MLPLKVGLGLLSHDYGLRDVNGTISYRLFATTRETGGHGEH
jgi:hypothetical protein